MCAARASPEIRRTWEFTEKAPWNPPRWRGVHELMNLVANPPTPCRIGKRPPAPKKNNRPSKGRRWRVRVAWNSRKHVESAVVFLVMWGVLEVGGGLSPRSVEWSTGGSVARAVPVENARRLFSQTACEYPEGPWRFARLPGARARPSSPPRCLSSSGRPLPSLSSSPPPPFSSCTRPPP